MNRESFWDYSLTHYALPGVAESCLRLQDEYGLDVNLVLCCLWYGYAYGELSRPQLECLTAYSDKWSGQVVRPLRQIRRWLKAELSNSEQSGTELVNLRTQVKKLELQAEHLQQNNLEALLAPLAPDTASAGRAGMENNLERYLLLAGLKTDASLQQLLNSLLETFACESR
ncbi:MAG: TIGR02444 family protein [Gammaproteobacteria bacterium]|jgi:uncharacterized protein (TIGR02444 family)